MAGDAPIPEGKTLAGALLINPMRVQTVRRNGTIFSSVGVVGIESDRCHRVSLTTGEIESLNIKDPVLSYDGNARLTRLGLQAHALGIAYDLDPTIAAQPSTPRTKQMALLDLVEVEAKSRAPNACRR